MKKSILAIAIPLIMVTGCHTMSFTTSSARGNDESSHIRHNALFDIIELSDPINVKEECKNGLAVTTVKETFLLNVLSAFTQGLWNPKSVDITCAPVKKS